MVIRDTVLLGDPRLREKSEPLIFDRKTPKILEDLKDTLTEHQRIYGMGRGLAAPQIGYNKRVVYIQTPSFTRYLINPDLDTEDFNSMSVATSRPKKQSKNS